MELSSRTHLLRDGAHEGVDGYLLLPLLSPAAHVDRPGLGLAIPDDQEVGDLLPGVLPDLLLHAVLRVVDLDPYAGLPEPPRHLPRVPVVPVGHGYDDRLHGREPDRESAGVVLYEHPEKPLRRAGNGAVQKDRRVLLAVLPDVLAPEAQGLQKVHLDG